MNMNWQPILKMFKPKRKKRGSMWASLIGLGITAAIVGVTRGKSKDFEKAAMPFQKAMKNLSPKVNNFSPKTNINLMNDAALAEFSEELMDHSLKSKNQDV